MWQKPWSSGAGTKVDGSSPCLGEGHSVGHFSTPAPVLDWGCHLWRDRKRALSSDSQCWWQNQCVVLNMRWCRSEIQVSFWTPLSPSPRIRSIVVSFAPWILISSGPRLPVSSSAVSPVPWPSLPSPFRRFLGDRRDLLPALPPLLWLSPLLLHAAARVNVGLHSPSTAFLLPFWANGNHQHHNYTDSTLDQGLETGWSRVIIHTRRLLNVQWAPLRPAQGWCGKKACVCLACFRHPLWTYRTACLQSSVLSSGICHVCCHHRAFAHVVWVFENYWSFHC